MELSGQALSWRHEGDVLMVTESMKMQVSVTAPRDGTIETIHVAAGDSFDKGAELIKLHED